MSRVRAWSDILGWAVRHPGRLAVAARERNMAKDPAVVRMSGWSYGRLPRVALADVFPGLGGIDVTLVRAFDRVPDTSVDLQEALVLAGIVRHTRASNIIEIGTFDGNTTLNLAANSVPEARVTTVDLPPDWRGDLEIDTAAAMVNVTDRDKVASQYRSSPHAAKITQIYSDSARLDWSTLPPGFDLVFIDGCHTYEYVKKDTENALPHMASGGVIVWHDYGAIEEVSRFVDEIAESMPVKVIEGTRLAVAFPG